MKSDYSNTVSEYENRMQQVELRVRADFEKNIGLELKMVEMQKNKEIAMLRSSFE